MILVAGATGDVGGGICAALRRLGKPVRALVRETSDPDKVRSLEEQGAEVVHGELRDPARLAESITGSDIAVDHVPAAALEQQAGEAAGTDGSIFPSLMLCQTRGDEIAPAPEWLRPHTRVSDYLRGCL